MRSVAIVLVVLVVLSPGLSLAKGLGAGFWMEGTVSDVQSTQRDVKLILTGRFWLNQYRDGKPATIEIAGKKGIPVRIHQAEPFFAMSAPDWYGGAISGSGKLLTILQAAAGQDRVVKFELIDPTLQFSEGNKITVLSAGVVRATDHDLQ